jgi:hypothetical protein
VASLIGKYQAILSVEFLPGDITGIVMINTENPNVASNRYAPHIGCQDIISDMYRQKITRT